MNQSIPPEFEKVPLIGSDPLPEDDLASVKFILTKVAAACIAAIELCNEGRLVSQSQVDDATHPDAVLCVGDFAIYWRNRPPTDDP